MRRQWTSSESLVFQGVRDDQQAGLEDRVSAERHVSRDFRHVPADPRLEPLPVQVNEANQGDRSSADVSSKTGEIVESLFRRRVEDRIAPEVFEPGNFVLGQRQRHY